MNFLMSKLKKIRQIVFQLIFIVFKDFLNVIKAISSCVFIRKH